MHQFAYLEGSVRQQKCLPHVSDQMEQGESSSPAALFVTECKGRGGNVQVVQLAEILICQRFRQVVGGLALKALKATSSQLCQAVRRETSSVRLKANMQTLVDNYFYIEQLHFSGPCSVYSTAIMSKGQWPKLKKLILRGQVTANYKPINVAAIDTQPKDSGPP